MRNPFQQILQQLNKYSRSDRNAFLILSALILLVLISNFIFDKVHTQTIFDSAEAEKRIKELEDAFAEKESSESLFYFDPNVISEIQLDSLALPRFVKQNIINFRNAGGKFYVATDLKKIYGMNDSVYLLVEPFISIETETNPNPKSNPPVKAAKIITYTATFNPNKAEKDELLNFGFTHFQAKNLVSYRDKGGVFQRKTDLLKIYGVDSAFFLSIEKYIELEKPLTKPENSTKYLTRNVELNRADSLALVSLSGIGPVFASRILKYRNLLGGFCAKEQLLEVYNFPEETYLQLKNSISVDQSLITPLRINFAEYNDLLKHPYINKKQVNALLEFRDKNGIFENVADIELLTVWSTPEFAKIKPYLTCR